MIDKVQSPALPDRLLHTMLRVGNLERSLVFYTELLGMKLLHRNDFAEHRFTIAFIGYGDENSHSVIELTHNWDQDSYELGSAYGHIALPSDDIYGLCEWLEQNGANILRSPGPMEGGPELAFIEDPDGYKIELIQNGTLPG
jgi:lactoylglutathione lyase|tara:strand:- start:2674 stop:3099 length:426 start_codon:yes stop_codon:yes gene_type:complete